MLVVRQAKVTTRCILWDFGDTLVGQDWMLTPPDAFPDWPEAWVEAARGELEEPWMLGEATCEDIANRVAQLLAMSLSDTMNHIRHCCTSIRFFDAAMEAARRCRLPQAIVTVNPDVFTNFVVPHYRLDDLFPVIVASWQEGTIDKTALCALALERFKGTFEPSEALLIDNIESNVRAWEESGGRGYVFVGDAEFAVNLKNVLPELSAA